MKVKKKSAQPKIKMVKANPINRIRALVYDVYAKCNGTERIVMKDIVCYHKCNNNIPKSLTGKFIKKTIVTIKDQRGYHWIGPEPDEKMIQALQKEVTGLKKIQNDKRNQTSDYIVITKASPKQQNKKLEFVFDDEVPEVTETPKPQNESLQSVLNQMQELFKKFL
jgi:hypothetical protein